MIEKLFKNPSAFSNGWREVSRFANLSDCNFDRFIYRVYGTVFEKDSDEFRDAFAGVKMWEKLKCGRN